MPQITVLNKRGLEIVSSDPFFSCSFDGLDGFCVFMLMPIRGRALIQCCSIHIRVSAALHTNFVGEAEVLLSRIAKHGQRQYLPASLEISRERHALSTSCMSRKTSSIESSRRNGRVVPLPELPA